ncbi:MAG: hypothetical protein Q8K85_07470 [Hyphomicrobium sp.]|nr:hypothetical protein [Hyphomicrobium sp.]
MIQSTHKNLASAASTLKRTVSSAALAAVIALGATAALHAQTPAPAKDAPAKVEAAPDLAPGIAPGVVPGARPGGMEVGPPAGANHPAFAPAPAVTPGDNAAVKFSTTDILSSPDWPCIQRKVTVISPAQVWDGPPIDGIKEFDPAIRDLTEILESRRVSPEDADKAIKEYAAKLPEAERDQKLTELFASLLSEINTDRQFVMSKVEEFQKRQKGRAAELEREGEKLAEKGIAATDELLPTEIKLTPEQQEYNWNARIFQERQQNLTMACEIPTLIEQRAYEIGRLIRAQMKS